MCFSQNVALSWTSIKMWREAAASESFWNDIVTPMRGSHWACRKSSAFSGQLDNSFMYHLEHRCAELRRFRRRGSRSSVTASWFESLNTNERYRIDCPMIKYFSRSKEPSLMVLTPLESPLPQLFNEVKNVKNGALHLEIRSCEVCHVEKYFCTAHY